VRCGLGELWTVVLVASVRRAPGAEKSSGAEGSPLPRSALVDVDGELRAVVGGEAGLGLVAGRHHAVVEDDGVAESSLSKTVGARA
jgi:hypothetical protein